MKLPYSLFSRRAFLNGLIGGWVAALGAAFIGPLVKYILPPTPEPDQVSLALTDIKDMAAGSVHGFAWGNKPGLLKKAEDGTFIAFVGVCTHLDCNVSYIPEQKRFYCACHEGWYDENGVNVAGPPPSPLRRLDVSVEGDTMIVKKRA
jgi:Rieske Fe-S protein